MQHSSVGLSSAVVSLAVYSSLGHVLVGTSLGTELLLAGTSAASSTSGWSLAIKGT